MSTEPNHPADVICGGPIDPENGICRWCKTEHERTEHVEKSDGSMAELFPVKCASAWERPKGRSLVVFKNIEIWQMEIECWHCKQNNVTNSVKEPGIYIGVSRGDKVEGICNNCGATIEMVRPPIIGMDEGRLRLNRKQRRALRKGN